MRATEGAFRAQLDTLADLPTVREVRGCGYFYAIEPSAHTVDGRLLTPPERNELYGDAMLAWPLERLGVMLRVSIDAGDPVISLAPPLVAGTAELTHLVEALREVLTTISVAHASL
ncbi:hypothetical protein [Williamsia sp. CHRR-6]|uniref:hypothetical protein n=1 Tax=Williamsia sp. CHRR-6 TaxID=2835871 RepID=UPI001BDA09DE|nr:hypothetical protein [Williamsia sp. CHRR-6]MBT0566498.1 hypothetical protein [Williamsia sp. CHRR-6]